MKRILAAVLFAIVLNNFTVKAEDVSAHKVIKVIDGDTVYIDFNDNGIAEANERVRLNGIDTFETKLGVYLDAQMSKFNLTQQEALGMGYLAKEFAKKELLNKKVIAKNTAETQLDPNGRPLMSIYYANGKNYEQEVLKAGLAVVYMKSNLAPELEKYRNQTKLERNLKKASQLELVYLNNRNGKYHDINCKYGQMLSDVELIKKPTSKQIKPSPCCHNIKKKAVRVPIKKPLIVKNDLNVYFVNPTANKYPQNECKNRECKALVNLISNSKESIDFALYGFNEQDVIFEALLRAKERGVVIRGVVDKDEAQIYPQTSKLKAGFDVKVDSYIPIALKQQEKGFTRATKALMHNKFFVVDNEYVWTGSTNISSNCMTLNTNNAVLIKSKDVAEIYSKEFNQMFNNNKFHTDKDLIPNSENILINKGKTKVSVYFSPKSEALTNYVRPLIQTAKSSIHIDMFYLTHRKIVQDLIDAHNRGVDVKIIVDGGFVADGYSPHALLREANIPLKIENWKGLMHMKTAVIDNQYTIIGSTNWTSTAELVNDENMLIIDDSKFAKKIEKNFQYLWKSIPDEWLHLVPESRKKVYQ